ncbi:Hexosyltransferase [Aphelenchoides besseyi]|nr:Hexosyltransferase [Aphelenchoides besseyi]
MVYGPRTWVPFGFGLICGTFLALVLFTSKDVSTIQIESPEVQISENWKVQLQKPNALPIVQPNQTPKVIRARFAATELGIRDKLMVVMLAQSALSVTLNASIGGYVPRLQIYADAARIDADMSALTNLLPYRLNGVNGQRAHIHVLNSIFDQALHESYDWFYFMPDTTYVNPFELMRLTSSLNWNRPVALGHSDSNGNCIFQAGVLLSNAAIQLLIQQRHQCNTILATSDHQAFEMCVRHATGLTCHQTEQGQTYRWWRVEESGETGSAVHDHVHWLATSREFNSSLSVSPLLSEQDAVTLHKHFVSVEIERIGRQTVEIEKQVRNFANETSQGPSWPVGALSPARPPSRYQVPVWEYFTDLEIFRNEPNQNTRPLTGNDALDIREVVAVARRKIEVELEDGDAPVGEVFNSRLMEFVKLRNGYRVFNALRGMEYILDLEYRHVRPKVSSVENGATILKRVRVCRPIHFTELLHQVPYVKEDTDITIVVPVESNDEAEAARALLGRHMRLCLSALTMIDSRQTRLVLAVRGLDQITTHRLSEELLHLKRKCKSWQTDTALLPLRPQSNAMIEAAALDEAIDHFGQQMIYVLLSPHADYQREFLDRVRINTIRHFQVFFPIPFAEFHPLVVGMDRLLNKANEQRSQTNSFTIKKSNTTNDSGISFDVTTAEALASRMEYLRSAVPNAVNTRPLVVHKDRGFFDTNDFNVVALYGTDYINARGKLAQKAADGDATRLLDLSAIFLGQSEVHLLRTIEPSLRIRYHARACSTDLSPADLARCQVSRKQSFGAKAQLANTLFGNLDDLQLLRESEHLS